MGGAILDRLAGDCLSQMGAFEQGPESSDEAGCMGIWRKIHSNPKE